jgi:hypothetical protein
MSLAIERHYESLKRLEQQKMQERNDFQWRMQAERELIDREKEVARRQKQENLE